MRKIILLLKSGVKKYQHGLFIGACLILMAGIGYNIGRISSLHKSGLTPNQQASGYDSLQSPSIKTKTSPKPVIPRDLRVVVTKNSKTKVYHHAWCSGASRIKEENKIWFATENEAISAGYTLAGNCSD